MPLGTQRRQQPESTPPLGVRQAWLSVPTPTKCNSPGALLSLHFLTYEMETMTPVSFLLVMNKGDGVCESTQHGARHIVGPQ